MTLTVMCLLVQGHVGYTPEYVYRLKSMVKRHLSRDHRFVCLTDEPEKLSNVETIKVPTPRNIYAWWSKTHLFNPDIVQAGSRVLYLDLDVLVHSQLDPVVDFPSPFALIPHAGDFNGKYGKQVIKCYNSSVMVWNAGLHQEIYSSWDIGVSLRLWGDQDWIAERVPDADKMPIEWFPRLSQLHYDAERRPTIPPATKVILCKRPKNHVAARQLPWFREAWR